MPTSISEFIQSLADKLPCVLRIDFEREEWAGYKITLYCVDGLLLTEMLSIKLLERKDSRVFTMVCEDFRYKIIRALTEHRAEQWQAQKHPGRCVALLQHGDFQRQTTLDIPPPSYLPVDVAKNGLCVMFALYSYDPVTRVALYRS